MRARLLSIGLALLLGTAPAAAQTRTTPAPAASLIDINSASRDDLMTLEGIGEVRADAIIRARPFKAKTDLVERRLIPEADPASAGRPAAPHLMDDGTIYALGTPVPSRAHPGAISVIRLSGSRAAEALIFLTERRAFERGHSARDPTLPEPRRMALRSLFDPM